MSEAPLSYQPSPMWSVWKESFGHQDRPVQPFSAFEKYIHLDGLPTKQEKEIRQFIEQLYSISGASWKPGKCRLIDSIASWAHDILRENKDEYPLIKDLMIKRHTRDHFWIELEMDGVEDPIIIDPTGVPLDSKQREKNITPYFGLLKDAKGFAQYVYGNKEEYDGDTRDFPPGFYP